MPSYARQPPPARPASIAIHDDGDMARQTRQIEFFEEQGFLGSQGTYGSGGGDLKSRVWFGEWHGVLSGLLLYAAKLTHDLASAQCRVAMSYIGVMRAVLNASTGWRRGLEKRGINQHQREDNHGYGSHPRDDIEGESVDVLAHQVPPVYQE